MTLRRVYIDPDSDLWAVRPEHAFFALALAEVHRRDQVAESGAWTCTCRCCSWARSQRAAA
jgi:hypothetical protein